MQIKNYERSIPVYVIEMAGSYQVGQPSQLAETLHGLGATLTQILAYGSLMTPEELEVAAREIENLDEVLVSFRENFLGSPQTPTENQAPAPVEQRETDLPQAQVESAETQISEDDRGEQETAEPQATTDTIDAEWREIAAELSPAYLQLPSEDPSLERDLVAGLSSVLQQMVAQQERPRAVRQIHIVEAHLMLMHLLGVEFVDPKSELSGFARLVNDVHALRILSRPSEHFLKEPIRGFRNAEQNGKVVMAVKLPNELDPGRVTDFFGFLPDRGMAYAQRELRDVGLHNTDVDRLQAIARTLEERYPQEVEQLRRSSRRVSETVEAAPF